MVDVVRVLDAMALLAAESEEALDAAVAVRSVQPLARGTPDEVGSLRCGAERVARAEECFDIDAVVDGSFRC